ncbi:AsmA family protein [Teichococcus vastitatis]|uniref:AsmA family protein n=1 Tax=Teichococcus vastitatis TaxID=2307076 RepID=UPI000E72DB4A|nr:AsmA family protein [Pseudoroseomonas vastitatis]
MPPAETRPRHRAVAIAILLLPVLVLAALWLGPRLTDWNEHRDRLAILAAGRLGQPVTLEGPVRLTLLPQPMLEAGGVTIGGVEGDVSLQARALRLRLDWPALLRLQMEPREVAVVGAEIRLPWPPSPGQPFRPPPWLTGLQGRIQDSRVEMGGLELDQVDATLAASGPNDALRIHGKFRWRQKEAGFTATLGRSGLDGVAPLSLTLTAARASVSASGVLLPEGGFEGSLQGGGSDLSALIPAPAGSFRLRGRLSVTAELITADELALDLNGTPVRGAATLRVAPAPRLDLALSAGRLELDPWVAALQKSGRLPLPFGLDLSAEAAGFRGMTLRRLRGATFLEGDRLTLTDFGALLPGDTEVTLNGTTSRVPGTAPAGSAANAAPGRLEASGRFHGNNLRGTLAALGAPLDGVAPGRLRQGEGRFRLTLDGNQIGIPEFVGTIDGGRVSGAGTLRLGNRPAMGLGLNLERLPLDGWLPPGTGWPEVQARLAGVDANLRLSAEQASWHDLAIAGLSADLSLESGRLTARRVAGRLAESDLVLSAVAQLGEAPRLAELALEASAERGAPLLALLAGSPAILPPLAEGKLALRLSGNGPPQALALQGGLELGDLRAEANGALDLPALRYAGSLTLRHPGAPRLLKEAWRLPAPDWLGEGSFSLAGNVALRLSGSRQEWSASHFDLIAAGLRLGGQVQAVTGDGVPRVTGKLAADTLPLPGLDMTSREPLEFGALSALDAELAITAQRVEPLGLPALHGASTQLRLTGGTLQLDRLQARWAGGTLAASLRAEGAAGPPALAVQGTLSGATVTEPLSGLPVDLRAGQLNAEAFLRAAGYSPAALMATLSGQAGVTVRNGVLEGLDLRAALAAIEGAALPEVESGLRQALTHGATGFEALNMAVTLEAGRASVTEGSLVVAETPGARLMGEVDLARSGLNLLLAVRDGDAPAFGLRLGGSVATPRLVPELADWLRWRAVR